MNVRQAIGCGVGCLVWLLAGGAAAQGLRLYTEEYPPFSRTDRDTGAATGMSVDIVVELMRRAGVAFETPVVVPWARAVALTTSAPDACMFSAARVPEREAVFQWIGPIGRNDMVMYARRADHLRLRSLADARPFRIGTYIGDATAHYFADQRYRLSMAASNRLNPPKLRMGRIDLWPVGRLPGLSLLRELAITDLEPVLTFDRADMYLACHRARDAGEVARLNAILREMYRDDTVRRIYARYGYGDEAPEAGPPAR